MNRLDVDARRRIVEMARLAPSAHNTQPARWRFEGDGSILLLGDVARRLPCADPTDRDFALSCGAAVEGTVLALGALGIGIAAVEELQGADAAPALLPMARLIAHGATTTDPLARWIDVRHTWRGGFADAGHEATQALDRWASTSDDTHLVTVPHERAWLADLADRATVAFLRDREWRKELCTWMRLSRRHPLYERDGMNREALHMGALEAAGAHAVLGGAFPWLDRLGLATALVGERARSVTASAIVLLHRPAGESPLQSGRVLYRRWLELTSLGFAAWPMSAAIDDPSAAAEITSRLPIPAERRLLAALRVGKSAGTAPARVRLPVEALTAA